MQLTDKDLIDFLSEIKDQLKQTMQSENIPEWELDRLFEKMILSHLDGSGLDEMSQDGDKVSEYYQDDITPDAEQDYDGTWHKV
jgi:hypothetical protein